MGVISAKKRKNSREKGKRGELELVHFLKKFGLTARRGQQFHGGPGSPDVICSDWPDVHIECKRVQASMEPYRWMAQAKQDAPDKLHLVAHRHNGQEWLAIIPLEELVQLLVGRASHMVEVPPEEWNEFESAKVSENTEG